MIVDAMLSHVVLEKPQGGRLGVREPHFENHYPPIEEAITHECIFPLSRRALKTESAHTCINQVVGCRFPLAPTVCPQVHDNTTSK